MRLTATEDRIDAELAIGCGAELVPELERLVRSNPLRERLVCQLMLALYRSGRQAAALDVYRSARHRLSGELGLEPGAKLRQLEQQVLLQDPALDAAKPRGVETRSHRRLVALGTAGAAVLAGVAIGIGLGTSRTTASALHPGENGLVQVRASSGRIADTVTGPIGLTSLTSGGGSLWAADAAANAVDRLDQQGKPSDRVPLRHQPGALAFGAGALWVAGSTGSGIDRIDALTDTMNETIALPGRPAGLCFCAGAVWAAVPSVNALVRIDPASRAQRRYTLPGASSVAAGGGSLWVASYDEGVLSQFDLGSDRRVATVHVGQGPTAVLFAAHSVWTVNSLDGTVSRIDPSRAAVTATVSTGSSPGELAYAAGAVWVTDEVAGTLSRIDPTRAVVTKTTPIGAPAVSIAALGANLWIGARSSARHRGGTLVLRETHRFGSVDPQIENEVPSAGYLGMVYDGLVAYDHAAGTSGLRLVPDLAEALPQPEDDGLTYVFRLRPGLHYSDGRRVRASDFRRTFERLRIIHSPAASFFSGVRGVTTDDDARTVSFTLTARDPDFVLKLALGFAVPIPPGSPMHEADGRQPIPGTGPYEVGRFRDTEIVFVRNPRFREWSHSAQPDGNPDRIVWRFGGTADSNALAVEQGRADWTGDLPNDLEAIAQRYPAQFHSNVIPGVYFAQLNTSTPPFNDLRVRQALNLAVDRGEVVRLSGGPIANTPTCQTISVGLPGYVPYCPYTFDPRPNGRWAAPDLSRARELVAASGTRGTKVTVWSIDGEGQPPGVGPYLAHVLHELDYRADARAIPAEQVDSLRSGMQALTLIFGPDWPSMAETYSLFVACNAPLNPGFFCDKTADGEAARAESLRLADPRLSARLWAAVDRKLVDTAAWVPLTTQNVVDIVSKRLGNYEFSPSYLFLPALSWVR